MLDEKAGNPSDIVAVPCRAGDEVSWRPRTFPSFLAMPRIIRPAACAALFIKESMKPRIGGHRRGGDRNRRSVRATIPLRRRETAKLGNDFALSLLRFSEAASTTRSAFAERYRGSGHLMHRGSPYSSARPICPWPLGGTKWPLMFAQAALTRLLGDVVSETSCLPGRPLARARPTILAGRRSSPTSSCLYVICFCPQHRLRIQS